MNYLSVSVKPGDVFVNDISQSYQFNKKCTGGKSKDWQYDHVTSTMWEGTDNNKHLLESGPLNATEERRVTLGVTRGKVEKLNDSPYLTYSIMESLKGETPRLEEEKSLRTRQILHRAYEEKNCIIWDNLTWGGHHKE